MPPNVPPANATVTLYTTPVSFRTAFNCCPGNRPRDHQVAGSIIPEELLTLYP